MGYKVAEDQRKVAMKLLKEWERQDCTFKEVEERITALRILFSAYKQRKDSELECRLENEPFAKFSGVKVSL